MKDHKYGLFLKRRFLPIFVSQFLGGFNDNLLRSGLIVLIAYADQRGIALPFDAEVLVTICSALLVAPFILFSYLAGQMADKYEKAGLVTLVKIAEVGIMCVVFYGFATENIYLLMVMLFISGTHSTFFGPIKYSILPDHLKRGELLAGNGFTSAGTYLGILLGMVAGGLLVAAEPVNILGFHANVIGLTAILLAFVGLGASLFIPRSEPSCPQLPLNLHLVHGTIEMVGHARKSPAAFYAILGLSWFLLVGSIYMTQFANYAKSVIHGDNEIYTLFLVIFSVGIAAGSVICDKLLKGEVTPRYAPLALVGVSLFTFTLVACTPQPMHDGLIGVREFIMNISHWPLLLSMLFVAISGGIYMVPLYAMLQTESGHDVRSQVIAASNLFDSIFMVVSAAVCAGLLAWGVGILHLFLIVAALNLLVVFYARKRVARYANRAA